MFKETETPSTTTLCLWCNRVMHWGTKDLWYDICDGCAPRALDAVDMLHARRRLLQTLPAAQREPLRAVR